MDDVSASFFETAAAPLAILDAHGNILRLNRAWESLLAAPAAAVGKHLADLLVPSDAERVRGALAKLASDKAPLAFDAQVSGSGTNNIPRLLRWHLTADPATGKIHVVTVPSAALPPAFDSSLKVRVFDRILQTSSFALYVLDRDSVCTLIEGGALAKLRMSASDLLGQNLLQKYKAVTSVTSAIERALSGEEVRQLSEPDPGTFFEGLRIPLRDDNGAITGVVGFVVDVTERVKAENEVREKLEIVTRQSEIIRALATPIIQVWDDVLCLPVIGTVDSMRASDLMQNLLETIVSKKPRVAIIDLTGVDVVDTSTAEHLLRLIRASKLLGVEGILCGIQPGVAQTIVTLGVDLSSIKTTRSMREALKWYLDGSTKESERARAAD
jgi:rsbT co-antagonist protein RsbR